MSADLRDQKSLNDQPRAPEDVPRSAMVVARVITAWEESVASAKRDVASYFKPEFQKAKKLLEEYCNPTCTQKHHEISQVEPILDRIGCFEIVTLDSLIEALDGINPGNPHGTFAKIRESIRGLRRTEASREYEEALDALDDYES